MTTPAGRRAVAQRWLEHEPGWGFRPDGWSLHVDAAQRDAYVAALAATPQADEDDHPDGEPFDVVIDDVVYTRLRSSRYGIRTFDRASAPGPGSVLQVVPEAEDAESYLTRLVRMYGRG